MSRWQDDDKIIAVQPMVICFSWEKQVSVAPKDVYRSSIFFFPHPFALAVNKSPAVYFLSRAVDGLWREHGGSVNRLFFIRCIARCSVEAWNSGIGSRTSSYNSVTYSTHLCAIASSTNKLYPFLMHPALLRLLVFWPVSRLTFLMYKGGP